MKRVLIVTLYVAVTKISTYACTVCGKQQPKIVRAITHGTGPQSDWDYIIVSGIVLIVLISLIYSMKWLLRPGEKETTHIKHSSFILE